MDSFWSEFRPQESQLNYFHQLSQALNQPRASYGRLWRRLLSGEAVNGALSPRLITQGSGSCMRITRGKGTEVLPRKSIKWKARPSRTTEWRVLSEQTNPPTEKHARRKGVGDGRKVLQELKSELKTEKGDKSRCFQVLALF